MNTFKIFPTYDGILFGFKKERNSGTCYKDEP